MSSSESPAVGASGRFFTITDAFFVLFLLFIFAAVIILGSMNYSLAAKTETAKRQAETLLTWFGEQGGKRDTADYPLKECGPSQAEEGQPQPHWAGCRAAMLAQAPFNSMQNSFNGGPLIFTDQCVPGEENLRGAIVIEKVVTLPEGSANPTVTSPLVDHDQLARKLGIRISICNRDSQAIFVDQTEF